MSNYQIPSNNESLPALDLPAGARPVSHPDYEHNVGEDPPEIEPIEHRLRCDFIDGAPLTLQQHHSPSKVAARKFASKTLAEQCQREQEYFGKFPDSDDLRHIPAFLQSELKPHYEKLEKIQQRRMKWYTEHIPNSLDQILNTVESLFSATSQPIFEGNSYVGVVIIPPSKSKEDCAAQYRLDQEYILYESELDDHTSPSEYGIELPTPLLIGNYANGSRYSLMPWSDGLVCGGPYKQDRPSRIMCKHELLSTMRLGKMKQYLLPVDEGVNVPQRARRFVSPTITSRHRPSLP